MSVTNISPQETRSRIISIAEWFEKGSQHNARCAAGALIPLLTPGHVKNVLNEIMEAERAQPHSTQENDDLNDKKGDGANRKAKRLAVRATLTPLVERHWQVLLACNNRETEKVFFRAKAHAIRTLVPVKPGLTTMSSPVSRLIFSCLPAQDLASLCETNLELNFQLKTQHPTVWQNLGNSYCLPQNYWPNFSKRQCLQNLGRIHWANQAFSAYTARHPGNSLVSLLVSLSGRKKAGDLRCDISDPQRRFVEHTRALICPMLTEGQPKALTAFALGHAHPLIQKGHFLDLLNGFASQPEEPRAFLNLVWTCGYPKNLIVVRTMLDNILENPKIHGDPRVLNGWVAALQWGVTCIPLTVSDRPMFGQIFDRLRHSTSNEAEKLEPVLLQILQRGIGTPRTALSYRNTSANLYKKLLASYQPGEMDNSLTGVLSNFLFNHIDGSHYTPREIMDILKCFPVELVHFDLEAAQEYLFGDMPQWLYSAAQTGGREMLQTLRNLGVRFYHARSTFLPPYEPVKLEYNTLDIALEKRASYALIALLVQEDVARISERSETLLERYPASAAKQQLRELLFGPNGPPPVL